MYGEILIWNKEVGFISLMEGSGDSLTQEDIDNGYVDYIFFTELELDGWEFIEHGDGGDALLTELYQEKFNTSQEVVDYMKGTGFIPDVEYIILHEEK